MDGMTDRQLIAAHREAIARACGYPFGSPQRDALMEAGWRYTFELDPRSEPTVPPWVMA